MSVTFVEVIFCTVGLSLFGEILLAEWRYAVAKRQRSPQ